MGIRMWQLAGLTTCGGEIQGVEERGFEASAGIFVCKNYKSDRKAGERPKALGLRLRAVPWHRSRAFDERLARGRRRFQQGRRGVAKGRHPLFLITATGLHLSRKDAPALTCDGETKQGSVAFQRCVWIVFPGAESAKLLEKFQGGGVEH